METFQMGIPICKHLAQVLLGKCVLLNEDEEVHNVLNGFKRTGTGWCQTQFVVRPIGHGFTALKVLAVARQYHGICNVGSEM